MRGFVVSYLVVLGWAVAGCHSDSELEKDAKQMKSEVQHEKVGSDLSASPKADVKEAKDLKVQ